MKVTVLMENTAPEGVGLVPEHGLSLYLEYDGRRILLDAGSSGRFADNAARLGVDLSGVELAVLSHGHYDHADGLRRFFQENRHAPVYLRPWAGGPYFARDPDGLRFIGIHRELWREHRERFVPVEGVFSLGEGIWLVPCTVCDPQFTGRAANLLYKRGEDDFLPDDYRHEQSLVFDTPRGLAVFNSCSHCGIVNIVKSVGEQLNRPVFAVVGGLHMFGSGETGMNCTPDYVHQVADALAQLGVQEIYTGHCTGQPAFQLLRGRFGPGCRPLTVGARLKL